jgi:DNA-binding ferritin-like protein
MSLIERVAFRYIQSASQPIQDLAGVRTWVNDTKDQGRGKGTPSPEKTREDYQDGKPQRDRVLPLPSGHPEGRTEYRVAPPVMNVPSDSQGVSQNYSKEPNPNAIPNQPNGKPLHERPRSSGVPGDEYGHPYMDQSQSTGLKRRVAILSIRPPKRRQRKQKGEAKRKYTIRRRKLRTKNRQKVRNKRRRYWIRNKHRLKRYRKRRDEEPTRFKRYEGGGVSTTRQRNQKRKKKGFDPMEHLDFEIIDDLDLLEEDEDQSFELLSDFDKDGKIDRRPSRVRPKRMPAGQRAKRKRDTADKRQDRRKQKRDRKTNPFKHKILKKKQRGYNKLHKNVLKSRRASRIASLYSISQSKYAKLTALQVLLATLRASHFALWTSHWQVEGDSSYGDHQLLERLYNSLTEEIDTLAEKIVGQYGSQSVEPVNQVQMMAHSMIPFAEMKSQGDPIYRALVIEEALQVVFSNIYSMIEGQMSLGLDDFIMSMANAHETNLYLLRQRLPHV